MTEQEWRRCADPRKMWDFLPGTGSNRKARLFAAACCRMQWELLSEEFRTAVAVAEAYADGLAGEDMLLSSRRKAKVSLQSRGREVGEYTACEAAWYATRNAEAAACYPLRYPTGPHRREQISAFCDIFGPFPFTAPYTDIDPTWLTSTVVALATGIYQDRAFDRLPILADALEDAGCDNDDLLKHLRSDVPHVLGCWALDLVLRKT